MSRLPGMASGLDERVARGELAPLDRALARSLGRLGGESRDEVLLACALVSRRVALGDVCLDLPRFVSGSTVGSDSSPLREDAQDATWPPLDRWLAALAESPLVDAPEAGRGATPLVLDASGRLYLRRAFEDEHRVGRALLDRARAPADFAPDALAESLDRLIPELGGVAAGPRRAASVAARHRLCVITGGPGTGKTSTAARLLAVLVEQALASGRDVPRIALAAPTGKAAARLAQAIAGERAKMRCSEVVRAAIPEVASTLHRLLGLSRAPQRWGRARIPRADLVLVDEASMVDLATMSRLAAALAPDARLVLLGDANQLASVEAGAVFADVCGPARDDEDAPWVEQGVDERAEGPTPAPGPLFEVPGGVRECVVTLRHSHRYGSQSGIGALARAIRTGDAAGMLAVLDDPSLPDVERLEPTPGRPFDARLRASVVAVYRPALAADEPLDRLRGLDRGRVLCALREGPHGVAELNDRIDAALVAEGLLAAPLRAGSAVASPGRPLIVTRNAPHLGLWNGDVGVLARSAAGGLRAWFEVGGALRSVGPSRLPPHEGVFAMTVHKSQGSEFDEVLLVLPDEPLPLLTRELLYTAVTRARRRVVVHARAAVLAAAVEARVVRASGLRDALWPGTAGRGTV